MKKQFCFYRQIPRKFNRHIPKRKEPPLINNWKNQNIVYTVLIKTQWSVLQ